MLSCFGSLFVSDPISFRIPFRFGSYCTQDWKGNICSLRFGLHSILDDMNDILDWNGNNFSEKGTRPFSRPWFLRSFRQSIPSLESRCILLCSERRLLNHCERRCEASQQVSPFGIPEVTSISNTISIWKICRDQMFHSDTPFSKSIWNIWKGQDRPITGRQDKTKVLMSKARTRKVPCLSCTQDSCIWRCSTRIDGSV